MNRNIKRTVLVAWACQLVGTLAVAAVVALTVPGNLGYGVKLRRGKEMVPVQKPSRAGLLWELPFNGRMADAGGWTLWLTGDNSGHGVDPKDLAQASSTVDADLGSFRWRLLSAMYTLCGSDLMNAGILGVLYALGFQCVSEYRARLRAARPMLGHWFQLQGDMSPVFGTALVGTLKLRDRTHLLLSYAGKLLGATTGRGPTDSIESPSMFSARIVRDGAVAVDRFALSAAANTQTLFDYFRDQTRRRVESEQQSTAELEFFAQAIPPLGFVGTVVGIGEAMRATRKLVAGGGLSDVASALGVAFNTTLIALVLFLAVEYMATQLRSARSHLQDDAENFLENQLFHLV